MRLIDADALIEYCNNLVDKTVDANDIARFPSAMCWISVYDQLPEDNVTVLAVKELKNGRREIALAYCIRNYERFNPVTFRNEPSGPYWVCGGNNNILYWRPLPALPEVTP